MEKTLVQKYKPLVIALSVIIPLAVAALFSIKIEGYDLSFLPPIYASTNGLTSLLLIAAFVAIKNGNRNLHEKLMKGSVVLSALFLVLYVAYHITSDPTPFGGEGAIRTVYFVLLISHITLSVVVIPFVLFTYLRAWGGEFEAHRKLAKITFPLWLYVTVTGVIVYLMISPYYA
ncbi:DUF420 domain-containing protein [Cytophagales bacterium LB-30]|uniref:DUF420 domain-containing protein n=1 Tax=Shiella aurantiaca TaxID=3058365 RepID=A0ABT8F5C7_9BACT|nr:DUF420 domain-containing protein [Shiella aurantiaca]MDN4165171.1 DUF420 domain-containing protein [Shiella aurantiaca]